LVGREFVKHALADKLLEAKIHSALSEHISLTMAPNGISVSVADGKVTLAGTCSNGAAPAKAEYAAREIAGVVEINNRITSVPSHGTRF
jgi:osmotically-inducible protein OsmY